MVCVLRRTARSSSEEVDQFIAKDARAARLQHDDRNSSVDLRLKLIEYPPQVATRGIEEAEIVERTSAATCRCGI